MMIIDQDDDDDDDDDTGEVKILKLMMNSS